ncbi:MAG: hypothetical protein IKM31_11180 [Oscillospiraceae bacterium]|nr:hypothetical protein [Oscillospiraceae bacterium]
MKRIFRSMCPERAALFKREWIRDGERDAERLVPAGEGYPCFVKGTGKLFAGDAVKEAGEALVLIDVSAPVEAGMVIEVSGGEGKRFFTCGTVKSYPSHKAVRVRGARYV